MFSIAALLLLFIELAFNPSRYFFSSSVDLQKIFGKITTS